MAHTSVLASRLILTLFVYTNGEVLVEKHPTINLAYLSMLKVQILDNFTQKGRCQINDWMHLNLSLRGKLRSKLLNELNLAILLLAVCMDSINPINCFLGSSGFYRIGSIVCGFGWARSQIIGKQWRERDIRNK